MPRVPPDCAQIVQLIGGSWDVDSGEMCLVLELCSRGSLDALLTAHDVELRWAEERMPIAAGIARAMAYLHGQAPPIVHRDLKPANVLLSAELTPKIADLGTAVEMEEGVELVAGSGSPLFQALISSSLPSTPPAACFASCC